MTRLALAAALFLGLSAPAAAADWTVDTSHSHVGFKVRHMSVSWVRGNFSEFSGTATTDESGQLTAIQGTVGASSVDTKDTKRDEHLRGADFFDVAKHAEMSFESTKVVKAASGLVVTGKLTIHGVTKVVDLQATEIPPAITDPWGKVKTGTTLTGVINRQDYGITWNKALDTGGLVVGDEVHLTIELELNLKP